MARRKRTDEDVSWFVYWWFVSSIGYIVMKNRMITNCEKM